MVCVVWKYGDHKYGFRVWLFGNDMRNQLTMTYNQKKIKVVC